MLAPAQRLWEVEWCVGKETANEVVEEFVLDHSPCCIDISLLTPIAPLCAETLKCRRRVPLAELRRLCDPTEWARSWQLPQKTLDIRLDWSTQVWCSGQSPI